MSKAAELGTFLLSNSAVGPGALVHSRVTTPVISGLIPSLGALPVSYLGNMELELESINRYVLIKRAG